MAIFDKTHDDDISLTEAWNIMKSLSRQGRALQKIETVIQFAHKHTKELEAVAQEQIRVHKERDDLAVLLATMRSTHSTTIATEKDKHDKEMTQFSLDVETAKMASQKQASTLKKDISVLEGQKHEASQKVTAIQVQATNAAALATTQEEQRAKDHQAAQTVRNGEIAKIENRITGLKEELRSLASRFKF